MIGDDIAAALPEMRAQAESLMTDTCMATMPDPDGKPIWNSATGAYDDPPPITVYGPDIEPHRGKCKLKAPALVNPFNATAGPESWQVEQSVLSIPIDAPALTAVMTVTYLTAAYNPNLAGRVFGVMGPHHESASTAQRVLVKEVVGTGGA